jgi:alpha-mannosidase
MTAARTSPRTIWSIGTRGAHEQFSPDWFSAPGTAPPPFVVGASDPEHDWPRFHPGPFNGATAYQPCTASVVFSMDDPSSVAYELVVDVRALVGSCPHLLVSCNGQRTLAVVDPIPENRGDIITQPPLAGGAAEVTAILPAAWLRAGRNVIEITTTELEAPTPEELRPSQPEYAAWFGSVLEHRGLLLREAPGSALAPVVEVRSLPLFERTEAGCVAALADLWVCVPAGFSRAEAHVTVDGTVHDVRLDLEGRSGGWVRHRLALDDVAGPRDASVALVVDGRAGTYAARLQPQRKWTLHLIPHVHLDVGYTDYQGKVFEVHSRNLDRAAALLDENPEYAFSVDGSLTVEKFIGGRSDEAVSGATAWMRAGRVAVNAFSVLFLTGLASLEECYRAAWTSADLRDRHGVPLTYANLTDVPSYSASLPSMLGALDVDWFLGIQNHTRGGNANSDDLHLRSPFRWQGVDGSEVIAYFSDQYSQLRFLCGDPPFIPAMAASFTRLLRRYERDDYAPVDLPIVGIASDNEDLGRGEVDLVARWNQRYAHPKLTYSTFPQYLRAVEGLRDSLPVVRGDGGSYWEDRAGTNALMFAEYRDAQALLPTAETLSVLTSRIDGRLRPPGNRLRAAWDALLLGCEHSWSATHSITHPHEEHSVAEHAW